MNELSLFTGGGGGVLGTQHLLGWRAVGYVEYDAYCQAVLKARIADGVLHDAPIFGDIREFVSSGCAEAYHGMVDVISAGFPCQPFSVAGKQRGADDERNMWPATIECIRVVRPRFAFLENVPGLLSSGYFGTIVGELAASGYDVRWRVLSAAEVGARHKRDRLWIVAYTESSKFGIAPEWERRQDITRGSFDCRGVTDTRAKYVANANDSGQREQCGAVAAPSGFEAVECGGAVSNAVNDGRGGILPELGADVDGQGAGDRGEGPARVSDAARNGWVEGWTESEGEQGGCDVAERGATYWEVDPADVAESELGRVVDGMACRVDRLRAVGNGQVPLVAAVAWRLLTEGI